MGELFPGEEVAAPGASRGLASRGANTLLNAEPPTGTVALVFTDVPAAARLWERCPEAMGDALEIQDQVLRVLLDRCGGYEVKTQGGAFMVAFASPREAVRWCLVAQEALLMAPWSPELLAQPEASEEVGPRGLLHRGLRVRMGVHVGEPEIRVDGRTGRVDYVGRVVNAAARVAAAGHGGQVLVSGAAWAQVAGSAELPGQAARPLGTFRLRGLDSPLALVEVLPTSLVDRRFGVLLAARERQGNVPAVQPDLIGRSTELETLRQWFGEGQRLVTLLGPGGMGKTRLATHFGGLELEACTWEGGVWLCELAEARTEDGLCHAVCQALGVTLSREREAADPVEQLGTALNGYGDVLIILDNLEQATSPGARLVERWLALAPRARFLVTSREVLALPEERLLELASLSLPDAGETRLEEVARSEAVRLFVQRAREVRGRFELTAKEAPHVVDIVRRLDGVALAIELAAARTGVLGVSQLRERLSRRFELLRTGRRGTSERQATLRGAIDWSWNLLSPEERIALVQCSVFRGGFTQEAAEAVVVVPESGASVRQVLQSLRDRSLLRAVEAEDACGEPRLGMYESIRQYAADRLHEQGSEASVLARHSQWYLGLAQGLRQQVRGVRGAGALRRLALERENLLAACDEALSGTAATPRSLKLALATLEALEPDFVTRGALSLLLTRLDRAHELAGAFAGTATLSAEILAVRGRVHLEAGHLEPAREDLERACAALGISGDVAGQKRGLVELSIVARQQGDLEAAWQCIQQAQQLSSGEDGWLEAYTRGNLGLLEQARTGAESALPHLLAAQELFQTVGDVASEVGFTTHCAVALGELGLVDEAVEHVSDAMTRAASVGDRGGHTLARLHLGCLLLEGGRALEAREHLTAAMRLGRQLGARLLEGLAMGELGRTEMALGELAEARHWLAEAVSALEEVARWHALRFAAHRAAVEAVLGDLPAALSSFDALEDEPQVRTDPVLRPLITLLRAAAELALADEAPVGSEEAGQSLASARRRVAAVSNAQERPNSSDMRGALRFLKQQLSRRYS
ncbi:ATP-binding protein [Hyalangium minutum]|uniref:Transcriptional regulator, LuxR family protein n=1 Tax=Hyalangium minutum TaxID=394096 RepID=A0A085W4X3_9BACT|nr:adenylate/guanylate cyclase domain-containing protein [Hyalangium minutum]KFE62736.1 transcriptional regulator, LuxR family protein [Hyalangium minutum]